VKIKHILRKNPIIYRTLMNAVEKYNSVRWKLASSNGGGY